MIDQDIHLMAEFFGNSTAADWLLAEKVYQQGAFTKPYAALTIENALEQQLAGNVRVMGHTQSGEPINGTTKNRTLAGSKVIYVLYNTTGMNDVQQGCHVGANPNPIITGCKFVSFF